MQATSHAVSAIIGIIGRSGLVTTALVVTAALVVTGCGYGSASIERFCAEVADLENADLQSLETSITDDLAVRAQLQRISSKFNDVLAVAPAQIREDVAVLAGVTAALEAAVRETNSRDPFERSAALLAAQAPYEHDLPDAISRYNRFVARSCTPAPKPATP